MHLYRLLITLLAPLLAGLFLWRRLSGREDAAALRARLTGPPRGEGPALWLHGASNGELASARPLLDALLTRHPRQRLWITANTVTGRDLVAGWQLPRTTATLAPLDLRWLTRRALRRQTVTAFLTLENELWPNRLATCAETSIPTALLAARMSERSARGWSRLPGLAKAALGPITLLSAQSEEAEHRFRTLGVPEAAIAPQIDLKALYTPNTDPLPVDLQTAFPRSTTVLLASTHDGEDALLLDAFLLARDQQPNLKAILAPRHPRRAEDIARLITERGLTLARRSSGEAPTADIYLADTMGEMPLWYRLAAVTFIGGSLVNKGGHTPHEPAAYGTAILHGPHLDNFRAAYEALDTKGGAALAEVPDQIAKAILSHLNGSDMPAKAKAALTSQIDLDALLARLDPLLPR